MIRFVSPVRSHSLHLILFIYLHLPVLFLLLAFRSKKMLFISQLPHKTNTPSNCSHIFFLCFSYFFVLHLISLMLNRRWKKNTERIKIRNKAKKKDRDSKFEEHKKHACRIPMAVNSFCFPIFSSSCLSHNKLHIIALKSVCFSSKLRAFFFICYLCPFPFSFGLFGV